MSAGNGKSDDFQIERLVSLVDRGVGAISQRYPATAQLSAHERSEQMDALIVQIETLTREHNALVKAVDGLMAQRKYDDAWIHCFMARLEKLGIYAYDIQIDEWRSPLSERQRELHVRIDAIERGAAVLSAWVRRPLWERLRAMVGL